MTIRSPASRYRASAAAPSGLGGGQVPGIDQQPRP